MIAFIYSEKVSLYYYWLLFHSRPHVVFSLLVITLAGKILKLGQMVMIMMMMMMIFIVPPPLLCKKIRNQGNCGTLLVIIHVL